MLPKSLDTSAALPMYLRNTSAVLPKCLAAKVSDNPLLVNNGLPDTLAARHCRSTAKASRHFGSAVPRHFGSAYNTKTKYQIKIKLNNTSKHP